MSTGRFGPFGGQYIPETLMNEIIKLEEAYEFYKKDPEFNAELDKLLAEYAGRPSLRYYAEKMTSDPNLKMIKVEDVAPSNATIEDGTYPLVNDFYMAIRASEKADSPVRKLRDWMLSENGKELLEEEGYVWARTGMEARSNGAGNIFK